MSTINTGTDITGLNANTSYTFYTYPINENGQESNTATNVTFTTPAIITSFTRGTQNVNDITVSYTGTFSKVSIFYGTTSNSYTTQIDNETGNSKTITGLSSNTPYYFNIKAYNLIDQITGYYGEITGTSLQNLRVTAIPVYKATTTTDTTGTIQAFGSNELTVSGSVGYFEYANGTYQCSESSRGEGTYAYKAANNTTDPDNIYWHCNYSVTGGGSFPYDTNGTYVGRGTNNTYSTNVYLDGAATTTSLGGEWIQYKLPYNLKLKQYKIKNRGSTDTNVNRFPHYFTLAGSTNGSDWYSIDRKTSQSFTTNDEKSYDVSTTTFYSYFRLIITQQQSSVRVVNISRFNLIGDKQS